MRRKILPIVLATLVIALAVPIGTALTLERERGAGARVVAVSTPRVPVSPQARAFAEAGSLFVGGGLLIGLASLVRRTG